MTKIYELAWGVFGTKFYDLYRIFLLFPWTGDRTLNKGTLQAGATTARLVSRDESSLIWLTNVL